MLLHWILITRFHRSYESSVRLTSGLGNVSSSRDYSVEWSLGRSTSLTGLQYQYTGYSINLAGGRTTLLAMAFPFNLIDIFRPYFKFELRIS